MVVVAAAAVEVVVSSAVLCWWRRSAVGRVSDLRVRGRGFESRLGTRYRNPGQVSHTCVHQAVQVGTVQRAVMPCG